MLKAINVTKRFGELKAVNDLSFEVQQGPIFGIAGPNRAGKSTFFNTITGVYKYEGNIEFDERDITGMPPYRNEVIRFVDLEQERFQSTGLLNLLGKDSSFFITCSRESRCTYNPILKTNN